MTDPKNIANLIAIAGRAIEVNDRETVLRHRKSALIQAYQDWKAIHCFDRVERDTEDWERMMNATSGQYRMVEKAKQDLKNAKRRLDTAIRRHREAA